jgi:hypothetical protein
MVVEPGDARLHLFPEGLAMVEVTGRPAGTSSERIDT